MSLSTANVKREQRRGRSLLFENKKNQLHALHTTLSRTAVGTPRKNAKNHSNYVGAPTNAIRGGYWESDDCEHAGPMVRGASIQVR